MSQKVIYFGIDGLMPELLDKFSKEGHLPHITQMMKEGAYADVLPFISTWGDLNWVSFMTGQTPGTAWKGHAKPPEVENNLLGLMEQEGKRCALAYFPETLSTEGTGHYNYAPFWGWKGEIGSPAIYSTHLEKWPKEEKKEFLGWPPRQALSFHEKGNKRPVEKIGENTYRIYIVLEDESKVEAHIESLNSEEANLVFQDNQSNIPLTRGKWSPWTSVNFENEKGLIRFKLMLNDNQKDEVDLLQSQINLHEGISDDRKLEQFLLERCGPFVSNWPQKTSSDELYYEENFEDAEYQALWLAEAGVALLNEQNLDMFATVYRFIDEVQHNCVGEYDPASPFYTPERAAIGEDMLRKAYQILDRAVGFMLEKKSEDTLLVLASDHGITPNVYLCDVFKRLEEFGLLKLNEEGDVIEEESQVYLKDDRGGLEIYINLKGREDQGIVEQEEYDRVQTEIFRALTTWYHDTPKGLQNVIGLTLKKQDAAVIGYWGPNMGDVIFSYNTGFIWGMNQNRDTVAPVASASANHGPQIPSASTGTTSNRALAVLHGPTTQKGYSRDAERMGPYFVHDVGTTMAKAMGLDTSTLNGRYMEDMFE